MLPLLRKKYLSMTSYFFLSSNRALFPSRKACEMTSTAWFFLLAKPDLLIIIPLLIYFLSFNITHVFGDFMKKSFK